VTGVQTCALPILPNLVLDQMSVATMVKQNEIERAVLQLVNAGQAGSVLDYELQIWTLDPADLNVADTYSNTHGNTYSNMYSNMYSNDGVVSKSVAGSTVSLTASSYLPGALLNLNFMVYNDSPDDEWISDLTLDFPAGVRVLVSSDFVGGTRGDMMSDNSLGDGALVSWHGVFGPQNYGVVRDGDSAFGTVQVLIAAEFAGELMIDWSVAGDQFGAAPHRVDGQLTLAENTPTFAVQVPRPGDVFAANDSASIYWTNAGVLPLVDLELSRDAGVTWEVLASNLANQGAAKVMLPGPASNTCVLRISTPDGAISDRNDGTFYIYESPTWVESAAQFGRLVASESQNIELTFAGGTLDHGTYDAWLVLHHNAADARTVLPLTMDVTSGAGPSTTPRPFTLQGAYPNPFNPSTVVAFELTVGAMTTIEVLDPRGRLLRRLFRGHLPVGNHFEQWDGRDDERRGVSAGVYLIRVRAGNESGIVKVVLAK